MWTVKAIGGDEFVAALTVRLRTDCATNPRSLLVELTDEADPLFHHSFAMGGDFHDLKSEQLLLIDFQSLLLGAASPLDQSRYEGIGLRGELQRAKEEGDASRKEAADVRQDNGTLRVELRKWREEAESAQKEVAQRGRECAILSSKLQKSQQEVEAAQKDLSDSRIENARARQRMQEDMDAVRRELAESRLDNARLLGQFLQAQKDGTATAEELSELRISNVQRQKEREDTLSRVNVELVKMSQELSRVKSDYQAQAVQIGQQEDAVQSLTAHRDTLREQLHAVVTDREAQHNLLSKQEQDIL